MNIPKKARRLAIKSALTSKVNAEEFIVLENIDFAEPKTKEMVKMLGDFNLSDNKALIITAENNANVDKSSRNIPGVKTINSLQLNVVDILHHDKVLVTKDAVSKIEEVFI